MKLLPATESEAALRETSDSVEESCGGREGLVECLWWAEDPRISRLIAALQDTRRRHQKLMHIAQDVGLRPGEVLNAFRSGMMSKALIEASRKVAEKSPEVAAHTMEDALSRIVPCATCNATGHIKDTLCSACHGDGKIRIHGNAEDRKAALEMAGLLGKSAAPTIVNKLAFTLPTLEETVSRGKTIIVEATEVEDEQDNPT